MMLPTTEREVAAESRPANSRRQTRPASESSDGKRANRLRAISADAPSKLALFRRVYDAKASPRQCIKAFCLECVWFQQIAITECTATACPLWNLRPYQRREGP
jgi:hypothetical protein